MRKLVNERAPYRARLSAEEHSAVAMTEAETALRLAERALLDWSEVTAPGPEAQGLYDGLTAGLLSAQRAAPREQVAVAMSCCAAIGGNVGAAYGRAVAEAGCRVDYALTRAARAPSTYR